MLIHAATIDALCTVGADGPVTYHAGQIGPVRLNDVAFSTDWTVATDEIGEWYYLHLPIAGHFHSRHAGVDVRPDRRVTALYRPEAGPFLGRWSAGYRGVCVALRASDVRDTLDRLLERDLDARIPGRFGPHPVLGPVLDISTGPSRTWTMFVLSLRGQMNQSGDLFAHPIVAAPLGESLLTGFLLAAAYPYFDDRRAQPRPAAPGTIRAAVDLIHAQPHTPLTVSALAEHCGVGIRALQSGFRRHLGLSPLEYLREVRLQHAHNDLRAAEPSAASVSEVARRWGFTHMSRFAASYEAKYGQTPSTTLRG